MLVDCKYGTVVAVSRVLEWFYIYVTFPAISTQLYDPAAMQAPPLKVIHP